MSLAMLMSKTVFSDQLETTGFFVVIKIPKARNLNVRFSGWAWRFSRYKSGNMKSRSHLTLPLSNCGLNPFIGRSVCIPGWGLRPQFFSQGLNIFIFKVFIIGHLPVDDSFGRYFNNSVGNCLHKLMVMGCEQDRPLVVYKPIVQ